MQRSIFQLIVLPHLAAGRAVAPRWAPAQPTDRIPSGSRPLSSPATAAPAYEVSDDFQLATRSTSPPPVRRDDAQRQSGPVAGPSRTTQQNLRAYLGMPFKPPDPPVAPSDPYPHRRQTAERAMQMITDSCCSMSTGSTSAAVTLRREFSADEAHRPHTSKSARRRSSPPEYELPLVLHRLLEARLFRLAVFHTLKTPEYAVDPVLVHRLADRLEHQGAGKLATRLRRGWDEAAAAAPGGGESGPKPKLRLWTDQEPGRGRRPPDHWRHLTTLSASSSFSSAMLPLPLTPDERARQITRFHNASLSTWLKGSSTKDPALTRGVIPIVKLDVAPNDWVAPGRGMRQLRALLDKISAFEKNRGFRPDRVTGCIIIRCWLACLANGRQTDFSTATAPQGQVQPGRSANTAIELHRIFDMVSRYYTVPPAPASATAAVGVVTQEDDVDYRRHVRPFATMMTRAFRDLGDMPGVKRVLQWLEEQKAAEADRAAAQEHDQWLPMKRNKAATRRE